jgi:hypothetical protein
VELVPGFSLHALFLLVLKFLQHFVQVHCRACQHEVGTEVGAVGYSTYLNAQVYFQCADMGHLSIPLLEYCLPGNFVPEREDPSTPTQKFVGGEGDKYCGWSLCVGCQRTERRPSWI